MSWKYQIPRSLSFGAQILFDWLTVFKYTMLSGTPQSEDHEIPKSWVQSQVILMDAGEKIIINLLVAM